MVKRLLDAAQCDPFHEGALEHQEEDDHVQDDQRPRHRVHGQDHPQPRRLTYLARGEDSCIEIEHIETGRAGRVTGRVVAKDDHDLGKDLDPQAESDTSCQATINRPLTDTRDARHLCEA